MGSEALEGSLWFKREECKGGSKPEGMSCNGSGQGHTKKLYD